MHIALSLIISYIPGNIPTIKNIIVGNRSLYYHLNKCVMEAEITLKRALRQHYPADGLQIIQGLPGVIATCSLLGWRAKAWVRFPQQCYAHNVSSSGSISTSRSRNFGVHRRTLSEYKSTAPSSPTALLRLTKRICSLKEAPMKSCRFWEYPWPTKLICKTFSTKLNLKMSKNPSDPTGQIYLIFNSSRFLRDTNDTGLTI